MLDENELLHVARGDLAFFSNAHKLDRERWVVDRWLLARGRVAADVRPGGDPPDFIVDGCGVEIAELMEPWRKRGDDYRAKLVAAEACCALPRRLVSRKQVVERGHEWVLDAIRRKAEKYGASAERWTLLIYVNLPYADNLAWEGVLAGLEALAPPFAAIEVVYEVGVGVGPVATTIWRRPG